MRHTMNWVGVLAVVGGLTACATPQSPHELSQATINYQCGPGGQDPLTVQYTFQGQEPLSARIIYQNQVVLLPRSTASNVDVIGNTFRSDHYTWITQKFDYDTVGSARGEMLMRDIVRTESEREHVATGTAPVGVNTTPSGTRTAPAAGVGALSTSTPADEVSNIIVRDCIPLVASTS